MTPAWRILDANANRALEGLRVLEDYARFALDDAHLTRLYKQLRHDLADQLARLPHEQRIDARDTQQDVGTQIGTDQEYQRPSLASIALANQKRVEQAVRCLEEYAKLVDADVAAALEALRYRAYTLAKVLQIAETCHERLATAALYVLLDERGTPEEFHALARQLVDAQADVIQLRAKGTADRDLLMRARMLRSITRDRATLFVMNDRPDLALLSHADGIHVGQDELTVKDVRQIVGGEMLIGVSTHSIEQVRQAVLDGANYIGCGPTFPSSTKSFSEFAGAAFLRQVADEIRLPAFAIGGITLENISEVRAAGIHRVAVQGGVVGQADPAAAVRAYRNRLL
jgi:thiamine-phosphate pyrophosphorylase